MFVRFVLNLQLLLRYHHWAEVVDHWSDLREIEINFLRLAWLSLLLSTRETRSAIWKVKLKWNEVIKTSPFQLVRRKLFFFNSPLTQLRWRDFSPWSWCWWMRFHSFTIRMSSSIRDSSSRKKSFRICFESELTNWKFNDTRWHPEQSKLGLDIFLHPLLAGRKSCVFWDGGSTRRSNATHKIKLNSIIPKNSLSRVATLETSRDAD